MSPSQALEATEAAAGSRLDLFVGERLQLSRAKVKALFEEGQVRVDGRIGKKGDRVVAGTRVEVREAEPVGPAMVPDTDWTLPVLYRDADCVVVDKPAGRASHPLEPGERGACANALVAQFPDCADASEDAREGGLCHRLDIQTSGALLAARSRASWLTLREAFRTREVDKNYWALVTGPIADEGEIDLPLRHHARHADRVEAAVDGLGNAREALSEFRVLARQGEFSLVQVKILTGVLHQVRAHLAAIGAPVVGDALYGGRDAPDLKRFFLHARRLAFMQPVTQARIIVESPLPPELAAALHIRGLQLPPI